MAIQCTGRLDNFHLLLGLTSRASRVIDISRVVLIGYLKPVTCLAELSGCSRKIAKDVIGISNDAQPLSRFSLLSAMQIAVLFAQWIQKPGMHQSLRENRFE